MERSCGRTRVWHLRWLRDVLLTRGRAIWVLAAAVSLVCVVFVAPNQPLAAARVPYDQAVLAQTTVILEPVSDATIDLISSDANFGSEHMLDIQYLSARQVRRALIRFNLAAAVPPEAIIDSARLDIFLEYAEGAEHVTLLASLVTEDWVESLVTWNTRPATGAPLVSDTVDSTPQVYKSLDVTDIVLAWHKVPHYGLELRGPEEETLFNRVFESREHGEMPPQLTVTYHLPPEATDTPTPTATSTRVTDTPTPSPTRTGTLPPDCRELLENGDFESGSLEPWSSWGNVHLEAWGHDSAHSAALGAVDNAEGELFQRVTIPAEAAPVRLDFWWIVEFEAEQPDDVLKVLVQYGEEWDLLRTLRAMEPAGVWQQEVIDLGAYAGRTLVVTFLVHTDGEMPSTFLLDDISLKACGVPPEAEELPDLVVMDVWREDHLIWYQIRNIGRAPVPEGQYVALFVDEEHRSGQLVDSPLEPGQRWRGCFDYAWECSPLQDTVMVWADYEDGLRESDETNNRREETWTCDTVPPEIGFGPVVSEVTSGSAVVSWETSEDSDSLVRYGKTARGYASEASDHVLTLGHRIALVDLEPSSTYRFAVRSADASGNAVQSQDKTFQTAALPDATDPQVSITAPVTWQGTITITAEASDNIGVAKVEFYIDDERLFTDYTPPYQCILDTTEYLNAGHMVQAKAYDVSGRSGTDGHGIDIANIVDVTAPLVTITSPGQGDDGTGVITVTAALTDDTGLKTAYLYFTPKGEPHEVYWGFYAFPLRPKQDTAYFTVDTSTVKDGDYRIGIEAYDKDYNVGYGICDVRVANAALPDAKLVVTKHEVSRSKNLFTIKLTVKNEGQGEARSIKIWDYLDGFQPLRYVGGSADFVGIYSPVYKHSICEIYDHVNLAAGDSRTYTYNAIPILIYPNPPSPEIGTVTWLFYQSPSGKWSADKSSSPVPKTTSGEFISQAYQKAAKTADYLIVTNPGLLYGHYVDTEVDILLSTMGELAKLKDGVLGYMGFNNKYTLDALIEPANYWTWITVGDSWASRMHPNFCKPLKGYLLIVGESEIVPAWEEGGFSIGFGDVKYSDHGYADAGGAPAPDLIVGRIIGDSAAALTKPIQASIGVHQSSSGYAFGRDNATLISGAGLGTFVSDINDMASILGSEFTVNKMHWKDYFPVKEPFQRDFQPDDGFAVGAVYGDDSAEIIIADASADRIFIYDRDGSLIYAFDRTFDGGDGLAVGYVMGSGRGQIIHADLSHDYVYVTDLEENTPGNIEAVVVDSFEASFDQGDFLAVGDLQGDSREDILIGDVSLNQVFIRDLNATTWSWFNRELEASDNLAVGDILGGVKDEVVIADRSANKILVYDAKGKLQASKEFKNVTIGSKTMTWLEYIDFDKKLWQDVGGSALAVGQLYPWPSAKDSGKEEILLAPAENYRHIFVYWWYADKKVLLDTGAIPFDFDGSNALATGDIGHYIRTQDEVLVADGDSFSPDYIRMFDTNNWVSRVHQALPDFTKDADLMYWSGHGNSHGWDDGIDSYWHGSLFPLQFNNHNPVVLGASCQTGYYEDGTLEDKNIAESFLGSGAAVYIGATQSSHGGEDTEATEKLFTDWKASQSIGEAFTKLEQDMWTSYAKNVHDDWWFWVWEYNLYGDPKFGRIAAPSGTEASTPPSTLQIEVPEYTVNVDHLGNGLDYVGIPGGRVWVERGQLRVPFYSTAITYPQGYEIQDVVLTERSGLVTDTGLHIPMTAVTVTPSICDPVPYSGTVGGWFPEEEYHWEVMENADGSTILNIVMYPLQYNPLTTDARFYGNYSFDINWTVSPLTVTSSATDKDAYEQGETVAVDIALSNSGEGQDAIVSAVIKRYGSGEIVDGLLLTTLGGLGGEASFSPQWDTTGFEPGAYYVEVTVEDTAGTLLDRRTEVFQVGIASGEVTHFSAMPRYFDVGDTISASLTFQNTGTVDLSGTALISVRDEAGAVVEEFAHDIADLSPGNSIQFDDIWDTSGAEEGSYTLVGYVAYISMTTDPVFASVSTGRAEVSLYLPIICKNHS